MKSQTIKYESYQLSNKSNAGNRIYENFHFLTIYVTKAGTVGEQIRNLFYFFLGQRYRKCKFTIEVQFSEV